MPKKDEVGCEIGNENLTKRENLSKIGTYRETNGWLTVDQSGTHNKERLEKTKEI
jgi:hypothetical protein